MRLAAVGTAVTLAGVMAVLASGSTGAFFSDTNSGTITGTVGSVKISTVGSSGTGDDGLTFAFDNLAPGVAQSITVKYENTGTLAQDVFLTFPDVAALHAINNLGRYGEIHIVDVASGAHLFDSTNLSDDRPDATGTCGGFGPAGCWPLPAALKVATNVAPSGYGFVMFSFNYPSKLGTATKSNGGGVFNTYPSPGALPADSLTSGAGLPVNVVAVQVGQQP